MMRERGFDAAPIDPKIEEIAINDYLGRTPLDAQKTRDAAVLRTRQVRRGRPPDRNRGVQPGCAAIDINAWGALTVAEKWGGPWASWCPYPLLVPSRDVPPFGQGLRPTSGRSGDCATRSWGRCSSAR
jgi:hypothetical protein